jgi:CHASE2 domain-containing sensor protein
MRMLRAVTAWSTQNKFKSRARRRCGTVLLTVLSNVSSFESISFVECAEHNAYDYMAARLPMARLIQELEVNVM